MASSVKLYALLLCALAVVHIPGIHGDSMKCYGTFEANLEYLPGCDCTCYTDCVYGGGKVTVCGKECDYNSDCTEGWLCLDADAPGANDVKRCQPKMCTSDSDCPQVPNTSSPTIYTNCQIPPGGNNGLCMIDRYRNNGNTMTDRSGCPCLDDLPNTNIKQCTGTGK